MSVSEDRSASRARVRVLAAALALLIPAAGFSQAYVLQTAGGGADVYAVFSDSCSSGNISLNIGGSSQRSPNSDPKSQSDAYMIITIAGYNSCTQSYINITASAPIQYSQILSPSSNLPRTVTASAQNAPAAFGVNDSVTFDVTMNATGQGYITKGETQNTYIGNPTTQVHSTFNGQQVDAIGILTVSTQQMGPLPLSIVFGDIYAGGTHNVTVNH